MVVLFRINALDGTGNLKWLDIVFQLRQLCTS